MPSTDRMLELKDIDGSDRLTAGCILTNLASPTVSQTAVYAKWLKQPSAAQIFNFKVISLFANILTW
jgi:hypothetical protein